MSRGGSTDGLGAGGTAPAIALGDCLVTFGIQTKQPETGYGYIEAGASDGVSYAVTSFKEKPDEEGPADAWEEAVDADTLPSLGALDCAAGDGGGHPWR